MKTLIQLFKFGFVGVVNTAIDLGVFNILIFVFGAVTGVLFIFFKALSFSFAVANSYVMNKNFVFSSKEDNFNKREFALFLFVSIMGVLVNVSIAFLIYTIVYSYKGEGFYYMAANAGAISGSVAVLFWNFLGYKFFVFRYPTKKGVIASEAKQSSVN